MGKTNDFNNKLFALHRNAMLLKKIREITNECLCNGAYSRKNEEEQYAKLDKANVPNWELNIISNAFIFKRKIAHETLKQLDDLLKEYEGKVINF